MLSLLLAICTCPLTPQRAAREFVGSIPLLCVGAASKKKQIPRFVMRHIVERGLLRNTSSIIRCRQTAVVSRIVGGVTAASPMSSRRIPSPTPWELPAHQTPLPKRAPTEENVWFPVQCRASVFVQAITTRYPASGPKPWC
jgi:hypothetical protein